MFFTLEERFQTLQHDFKEKYYHHFTDEEENKLIYMDIFKEYVSCSRLLLFSFCLGAFVLGQDARLFGQDSRLLQYPSLHCLYINIYLIIHFSRGFLGITLQHLLGNFGRLLMVQFTSNEGMSNDALYVSVKLR